MACRHLGYKIDEWLALPWWQRRLLLEQMNDEAEDRAAPQQQGDAAPFGAADPYDAILNGSLDDVSRAGFTTE